MHLWPFYSPAELRAMYAAGRGDATARRLARRWAAVFGLGLLPRRWVTLEVPGRRSGRPTRFPLGMADWNGRWYLVPMLGARCNWVQNVRAADGRVTLDNGRAVECRLVEVPAEESAPILRRYLQKVPGARPHLPVGPGAPLAEFERISVSYPVFLVVPSARARRLRPPAARRRHWWRWIAVSVAAAGLLIFVAVGAFIRLQPTAAPLRLPAGPVSAPAGPLTGTWRVAAGSLAGFRVQERALGFTNYTVGRTAGVTGAAIIAGDMLTSATIDVDLATVTVGGKTEPQFADSLGTRTHRVAVITLTHPVVLNPRFATGATMTFQVAAELTMNGGSHPVVVTFSARRDGTLVQAAGSLPVTFATWDIGQPRGFGLLGSLASHGMAEFLLILRRS